MKKGCKEIDHVMWSIIDNKTVLIIGNKWNGDPLIGANFDILIIPEKIFNKYKSSFIGKSLENVNQIFLI